MKVVSFTANFYSSAKLKLNPFYSIHDLDKQEEALSKDFKEKTAKFKSYKLIASEFFIPDDETIFILKRGEKITEGRFDFLGYKEKMNSDTLVEIFNKLKNKMKLEMKK